MVVPLKSLDFNYYYYYYLFVFKYQKWNISLSFNVAAVGLFSEVLVVRFSSFFAVSIGTD